MSVLYLVSTPIGNLEDISQRALRILREVRLIAAEDTRVSRKLLMHYDIQTPVKSYHDFSSPRRLQAILDELTIGDVALISDAGTPGINDPGYELVRGAIEAGHEVRPVPGPSAPIAALAVSGLPAHAFLYLGYLPRKASERQRLLKQVSELPYTLIFLETPHRLLNAIEDLLKLLGNRELAIAREMTKMHEEIFRGNIAQAQEHFQAIEPRGEFTLVVAGKQLEEKKWTPKQLQEEINSCLDEDKPPSQIAADLAERSGWRRREIYQQVILHSKHKKF